MFGWWCHLGSRMHHLHIKKTVSKAFKYYLDDFTKLFWDDFMVFSALDTHLFKLWKCFEKCQEYNISFNSKKCAFMMYLRAILGFIVSKEGKQLDPNKVEWLPKTFMTSKSSMVWPSSINVLWIFFVFIMAPIAKLMQKLEEFIWTRKC